MRKNRYNYFDDDLDEQELQEEIRELVDDFTESQTQEPTVIEHTPKKEIGYS